MGEAGQNDVEELTLEPATGARRSRRPGALWGVLAAAVLATGALVAIAADDDGSGTRPGLPVVLGSAAGGGDEAAMAADSMLAWVTYVAAEDLPLLGGEAPAYRLAGGVDEARVRALAEALGVEGELAHEAETWSITSEGASLEVYEGAGGQWWYSSAVLVDKGDGSVGSTGSGSSSGSAGGGYACPESTAEIQYDCEEPGAIPPCPVDATCTLPVPAPADPPVGIDCAEAGECPEEPPPPAADLPSEDEARVIALDLLAAAGVDVEGADVSVEGPYEAWYVSVAPLVDGFPSGLVASVTVGPYGEVTTASGYLGTPERLGDYPVLDTRAAIDRANAQQGELGAYGGMVEDTAVTGTDEPATTIVPGCRVQPDGSELCQAIEEPATTTPSPPCQVQPDGREICEQPAPTPLPCTVQPDGSEVCEPLPPETCVQVSVPGDEPAGAPTMAECPPPADPGPVPEPPLEPEKVEILLVDAEPALVPLGANDGSTDLYLVPGYRFTDADGGRVDLPAVADEALTSPPPTETTETTVPEEPVVPDPGGTGPTEPQPCGDVLVEEDSSGTTHTVQPPPECVDPVDPTVLEIGVGYPVEVLAHCSLIPDFAGQWWAAEDPNAFMGWPTPTLTGTFTLSSEQQGTFVADGVDPRQAAFTARGPAEEAPGCD